MPQPSKAQRGMVGLWMTPKDKSRLMEFAHSEGLSISAAGNLLVTEALGKLRPVSEDEGGVGGDHWHLTLYSPTGAVTRYHGVKLDILHFLAEHVDPRKVQRSVVSCVDKCSLTTCIEVHPWDECPEDSNG